MLIYKTTMSISTNCQNNYESYEKRVGHFKEIMAKIAESKPEWNLELEVDPRRRPFCFGKEGRDKGSLLHLEWYISGSLQFFEDFQKEWAKYDNDPRIMFFMRLKTNLI